MRISDWSSDVCSSDLLAAFHAWQKGVQRIVNTTFVDSEGDTQLTQFVTNAGNAKTYGLEFEGTLIPWKGMTIEGSAAYLHARYEKGSRFENQLVGGELVEVDRSGEPITQAPKWTARHRQSERLNSSHKCASRIPTPA